MKKKTLIYFAIFTVLCSSILSSGNLPAQESPVAYFNVKKVKTDQKAAIKSAGQKEWQEVQKFGSLFIGDSLRIPGKTTIILGDTKLKWKEYKGPRILAFKKKNKKRSTFGRFVDRLYLTFVKERNRRSSTSDAVKGTADLLIALPDTVFAFHLPEKINWLTNEPWWTEYQIKITHNKQTLLDTIAYGKTFQLEQKANLWTKPGNYFIKVYLEKSDYLESNADSCIINILNRNIVSRYGKELETLKAAAVKNGKLENYFKLANFCLAKKLYPELESTLIRMIKQFPDNLEPQMMLYAYYSSFLPPDRAEQLIMFR